MSCQGPSSLCRRWNAVYSRLPTKRVDIFSGCTALSPDLSLALLSFYHLYTTPPPSDKYSPSPLYPPLSFSLSLPPLPHSSHSLILSLSLSLFLRPPPPPHTCTPQDYIRLNVNVRQQQKSVNLEVQVSTILSLFTASETHFNTQ